MTKNEAKLLVGDHLLKAMKSIDEALMMLHQLPDDYNKEVTELRDNKTGLKRVLNRHFDECAIRKSK
jgi:hypothetical protein